MGAFGRFARQLGDDVTGQNFEKLLLMILLVVMRQGRHLIHVFDVMKGLNLLTCTRLPKIWKQIMLQLVIMFVSSETQ